jgi:hypothetical protein
MMKECQRKCESGNAFCDECERAYLLGRQEGAWQATLDESHRIIDLLQKQFDAHTLIANRPNRTDSAIHHAICRTYQTAIELIEESNEPE